MKKATPIIFSEDTSILLTEQDVNKVQDDLTLTFIQVSEWFKQNCLSLNISNTYFNQFF
jgi:hypothetical protein